MATVEEIGSGSSDALFVYLGAPDEISHETGGIGMEYREAIAAADRHVGRLVAAVRARPAFPAEGWLILVSTDHGRTDDGNHGGDSPEESTVFVLAAGAGADPAASRTPTPTIMDVAVTALAHLGIVPDPSWGLDGRVVGVRPSRGQTGERKGPHLSTEGKQP
jgi:arylsulfatase A-like enzyme